MRSCLGYSLNEDSFQRRDLTTSEIGLYIHSSPSFFVQSEVLALAEPPYVEFRENYFHIEVGQKRNE